MKKHRLLKNRKGAALAWMLMAFTVLMILMTSIVYITTQDIRETRMQEERIQTYYIALAGIELTYAAVMNPTLEHNNAIKFKELDKIFTKLDDNENTPLADAIEIGDGTKGIANVTMKKVTKDEKDWLQITSVGKLAGKNTEVTSIMRINRANPNQVIREKFEK